MKQPIHKIGDKFELDGVVLEILFVSPTEDSYGEYNYFVKSVNKAAKNDLTYETIEEFDLIPYKKLS
jgi:hypothetical protein